MNILVGGLRAHVALLAPLLPYEQLFLDRLATSDAGTPALHVVISEPTDDSPPLAVQLRPWDPCPIEWAGDDLVVRHSEFAARIEPGSRTVRIWRTGRAYEALSFALRAALAVLLPLDGALAIHSCGAVSGGRALVFFGRSGAGKTTLAKTCPHPQLSDELVALDRSGSGWMARGTGFWGGSRVDGALPPGSYPLAALVALDKTPAFELERLATPAALRALIGMLVVPPHHGLWAITLGLLVDLTTEVPVYRMGWALGDPPWDRLDVLLT